MFGLRCWRKDSSDESGQDLVEYALVIAVVCLGIISGMNTLANGINTAMSTTGHSAQHRDGLALGPSRGSRIDFDSARSRVHHLFFRMLSTGSQTVNPAIPAMNASVPNTTPGGISLLLWNWVSLWLR